ncbi:MAG: hypothetical protein Q8P67_23300 [archaeon]|nr:hypothetical protein [archaeon]
MASQQTEAAGGSVPPDPTGCSLPPERELPLQIPYEVLTITSFLRVFRSVFRLQKLSTWDIEQAFQEGRSNALFSHLFVRLLSTLVRPRFVSKKELNHSNWPKYFASFLNARMVELDDDHPLVNSLREFIASCPPEADEELLQETQEPTDESSAPPSSPNDAPLVDDTSYSLAEDVHSAARSSTHPSSSPCNLSSTSNSSICSSATDSLSDASKEGREREETVKERREYLDEPQPAEKVDDENDRSDADDDDDDDDDDDGDNDYSDSNSDSQQKDKSSLMAPLHMRPNLVDQLPMELSLGIFTMLCEWAMAENLEFESFLPGADSSELRIEPLGADSKGNTYWSFGDWRLFRESAGESLYPGELPSEKEWKAQQKKLQQAQKEKTRREGEALQAAKKSAAAGNNGRFSASRIFSSSSVDDPISTPSRRSSRISVRPSPPMASTSSHLASSPRAKRERSETEVEEHLDLSELADPEITYQEWCRERLSNDLQEYSSQRPSLQLVCETEEHWNELLANVKKSRLAADKKLLPELWSAFEVADKQFKKRLQIQKQQQKLAERAALPRKRSSRLVEKELWNEYQTQLMAEQAAEEERLRAEEAQRRAHEECSLGIVRSSARQEQIRMQQQQQQQQHPLESQTFKDSLGMSRAERLALRQQRMEEAKLRKLAPPTDPQTPATASGDEDEQVTRSPRAPKRPAAAALKGKRTSRPFEQPLELVREHTTPVSTKLRILEKRALALLQAHFEALIHPPPVPSHLTLRSATTNTKFRFSPSTGLPFDAGASTDEDDTAAGGDLIDGGLGNTEQPSVHPVRSSVETPPKVILRLKIVAPPNVVDGILTGALDVPLDTTVPLEERAPLIRSPTPAPAVASEEVN